MSALDIFIATINAELPLRLVLLRGDEAPASDLKAPSGSLFLDRSAGKFYANFGTVANPLWRPLLSHPILDKFTEVNGKLLYDGQEIGTKFSNEAVLLKFTEENGELKYNGNTIIPAGLLNRLDTIESNITALQSATSVSNEDLDTLQEIVAYITQNRADLQPLIDGSHTHGNKDALDKLTENNGKPAFDGKTLAFAKREYATSINADTILNLETGFTGGGTHPDFSGHNHIELTVTADANIEITGEPDGKTVLNIKQDGSHIVTVSGVRLPSGVAYIATPDGTDRLEIEKVFGTLQATPTLDI
ncbi:hypothetical protein FUAX_09860 [Fulvitalea axinellae]|uniref:Tail fiber protein n=1 Tax=Fulvitalea axinellae TaxID=1182444 RepID=A0AAU9D2D8_9BACT|nr:hypothetical protein FUAX_09860 [Fulvitalea axinellae]